MSKKQRERVEDEANFHKRRLSQQLADGPDVLCEEKPPGLPNNNNEGEMLQRLVNHIVHFELYS